MPMPRLSRADKKKLAWGAGGAALIAVGLAALGKRKPKKKKVDFGIRVNQLCTEFTVTDPTRLRLAAETTWNEWLQKGVSDPWVITSSFIGKVAPQCKRPGPQRKPGEMRSPGEALFYYAAFVDTVCYLRDRKVLTDDQVIAESKVAQAWAIQQGVEPNDPDLADPACATGGLGGGDTGGGGTPPDWLICDPPTVARHVGGGVWECRCPNGSIPQYVQEAGGIVPVCP